MPYILDLEEEKILVYISKYWRMEMSVGCRQKMGWSAPRTRSSTHLQVPLTSATVKWMKMGQSSVLPLSQKLLWKWTNKHGMLKQTDVQTTVLKPRVSLICEISSIMTPSWIQYFGDKIASHAPWISENDYLGKKIC